MQKASTRDLPTCVKRPIVWLVDDCSNVLRLMSLIFVRAGFTVEAFSTGQDALDALRNGSTPSAIVSDIDMPGLDGKALAQAASELVPDLPIVLVSGRGDQGDLVAGNAFVSKPFRADDLVNAVTRHLPSAIRHAVA